MKLRPAIFLIHLTAGCLVGVVVFFLAATGFLLAWQYPIIQWQERGYRTTPPADAAALPVDQLIAHAAAVSGKRPTAVVVQSDPRDPVEVEFDKTDRLFLNRYSGVVLGAGALRTRAFFTEVTALHRWFGAAPQHHAAAKLVKGPFDLALLLMIVTGVWLWMPRTWSWQRLRAGAVLRWKLRGRARSWNQHNVIGFWAALPLFVIALTGAILTYGWMTRLVYFATGSPEPAPLHASGQPEHHGHRKAPSAAGVSIATILAEARLEAVGWHEIRIALPHSADRTIDALVDFGNGGRPDQQARILYDRGSGAVVALTTFSSFSLGQQIRSFMKYIHTGEAGGWIGESAAGLTALACCVLIWTGFAMALRRLQAARLAARREAQTADAPVQTNSLSPID